MTTTDQKNNQANAMLLQVQTDLEILKKRMDLGDQTSAEIMIDLVERTKREGSGL